MTTDGGGEWFPLPDESDTQIAEAAGTPVRTDSLLPADPHYGVPTYDALRAYLSGFIELMSRHTQPLSLLSIAPDAGETLQRLGPAGARLIGSAIARCLRQETRVYDVIGLGPDTAGAAPAFILSLPMMTEDLARPFAERLREAMTISTGDAGRAGLTLSVGIASLSLEADGPELLILRAQEALASAQRSGGDRVWSHSDTRRRIMDRDRTDSPEE